MYVFMLTALANNCLIREEKLNICFILIKQVFLIGTLSYASLLADFKHITDTRLLPLFFCFLMH